MSDERTLEAAMVLSDRKLWPLDAMADYFAEAGIDQPRPSEVLHAFFVVLLGESADV